MKLVYFLLLQGINKLVQSNYGVSRVEPGDIRQRDCSLSCTQGFHTTHRVSPMIHLEIDFKDFIFIGSLFAYLEIKALLLCIKLPVTYILN